MLAELNDVSVTPMTRRLESLKGPDLGRFDVIVGSDICFWDSLVKSLNQMINRAMKNGVERIIITDPGRPTFYELCDMARKKHDVELSRVVRHRAAALSRRGGGDPASLTRTHCRPGAASTVQFRNVFSCLERLAQAEFCTRAMRGTGTTTAGM